MDGIEQIGPPIRNASAAAGAMPRLSIAFTRKTRPLMAYRSGPYDGSKGHTPYPGHVWGDYLGREVGFYKRRLWRLPQ